MDFQLLQIMFTIGKFFALTPRSIKLEKQTFIQKFYAVAFFLALSIGVVVSIYSKSFHRNEIHIKIVLMFFKEASLYCFNYYVIVVTTFYKRRTWTRLLKNLESCAKIKKTKRYCYYYYAFFGVHLAYGVVIIYSICVQTEKSVFDFLCRHTVEYFQNYIHFFYQLLLYLITDMILMRYKELNRVILDNMSRNHLFLVRRTETLAQILNQTVNFYNSAFGWPIAFLIFFATLDFLDNVDTIMYEKTNVTFVHLAVLNILRVGKNFVCLLSLIILCDCVVKEAQKSLVLTYEMRWYCQTATMEEKQELYEFSNFVSQHLPKFSAANFFDIERSTILSVLGTACTFLIIIVQFRNS
ncbi:gustatory receptor 37 [Tribolium castaneum]|uniref:Gustatory receptor n=1 Tax=Tribolium castaneum TaxID=7070 RepID=A2AXA5_TRICA|nr:gustatory receptor 37 [Tribolium castaneum]CAL23176.2 gustatory receptor candidate 43 [Tribolium castaneum]